MDETKFSSRQKKILSLLFGKTFLRAEIENELRLAYPVSKMTLLRDLHGLERSGLIKKEGLSRSLRYSLFQRNPLLEFIDVKEYFSNQAGRDQLGKIFFNFGVFENLANLIEPDDLKEFKITQIKLSDQEKKLDPTIFRREIERFTIEFAWKSSRIEGNTYSLLETEILIKQSKEAPGHSQYEAAMILNHKKAIDYFLKVRNQFKTITLSQILNLQSILTKDLEITGGLRGNPVAISGTNYTPLSTKKEIEKALKELIEIINKTSRPLEKALIALSMLSYLQPFNDGNKRTARVLANAILISHDYYPISFRNVSELDYLEALILFYERNNLFPFKCLFLEQYRFALLNYFKT